MNATISHRIAYDAASVGRILGLLVDCNESVPKARDGEILVYYGGWSLRQLRLSIAGQRHMFQDQDWYDDKDWRAELGYYSVLLRTPGSNLRTYSEQLRHLWTINVELKPSPVCVSATAVLVHLTETRCDLLKNDSCRCVEPLPNGLRVGLAVDNGRMLVCKNLDPSRDDHLRLAAAQKR